MQQLYDAATRDAFKRRLMGLTPTSTRVWGRMTPDQMVWHCAEAMAVALGKKPYESMMKALPLPKGLIRFLLVRMPWPRGKLDTAPQFVAKKQYDFETERTRLLGLIDELVARDPASRAQLHPVFGEQTMAYQACLQAKHLNHHLTQFGQ